MSDSKTIEQYAEKYQKKYFMSENKTYDDIKNAVIAGAAKQKELDAEKIKDYEQALKFECGNRCSDLNPCNAKEVLKKREAL